MTNKHRHKRSSMKSFSESYNNPERYEKVKETRKATEEKRKRALNTIESQQIDRNLVDKSKTQSLSELIEDLQGQCESLYAHYDHLTGDLNKKVNNQQYQEETPYSSANSDSDLDSHSYHSTCEKGSEKGKLENEIHTTTDRLHQELETAIFEISDLKSKFSAHDKKADLESHNGIVSSKPEASEKTIEDLRVEIERLNHEKSELLAEKEEREEQISSLQKKLKANENELNSRIKALTAHISHLTQEVETLRAKGSQLEEHLARQSDEARTQLKESKNQISALEHQLKTLQAQNGEINPKLERNAKVISEYQIQIEGLHEKLSRSDLRRRKTEDMSESWVGIDNLHEKSSNNDAHLRKTENVPEYRIQIEDLHEKLSTRDEHLTRLLEENLNLAAKLDNRELEVEILHDHKNGLNELYNEATQLREEIGRLQGRVLKSEKAVQDLEKHIEDLKIDLEAAKDEASTAKEKTCRIELQLRLANQKLRGTEQLLNEKEKGHKSEEKKFKEECELLQNRISRLKHTLAANSEAYCKIIINISKNANSIFAEMEHFTRKFEDGHEKFSNIIFKIASDVQNVKSQTTIKNTEREQLKEELSNISKQLQNEREKGLMMQEEIYQLGEEKREAIRQLCLWCNNLQSRYDEVKRIISESTSQRLQNR